MGRCDPAGRRTLPFVTLLALLPLLVPQAAPEPRDARALPLRLRGIAVGVLAQHHPNPCYAQPEGDHYVWRHDTTVQSLVGDLTLFEFGAYIHTEAGWLLRASMDGAAFASAYGCRRARLRKGRVYTDRDNARRSPKPVPGDALWYFLARDAKGRVFKGTALVETEAERPGTTEPRRASQ